MGSLPTPTPVAPLAVRAPLLVPAVCALVGAWLAGRLAIPSIPLVVALGACSLALRRRRLAPLAWLALGLLWGEVRWAGPQRQLAALDLERPVALTGEVSGCWGADEGGESAWLAATWVRQGRSSWPLAVRVRLHAPAGETARGCGGTVTARGTLRPPRVFRNRPPVTVGGWSLWVKSAALLAEVAPPEPLARVSTALRGRIFPPAPEAPAGREETPRRVVAAVRPGLRLARAFLLGDGRALPPEQREAMRRLGLAHLVAVSGLNVGLVAALFLALLLRVPRPLRLLGTLAGICGYALLVGPLPSLLRALLMAAVVLLALLLRRLPAAANALAAACLLLVLVDPSWVDDLGFQLSVAATVGLMALSPPLAAALRRLGWLAAPLAVTLAAQLATLPWALAEFHRLSPAAPLANLLAVPWAGVALAAALAWAGLRLLPAPADDLAAALVPLLDALALPLEALEHLPSAGGWVTLPLTCGWAAAAAVTALLAAALCGPRLRGVALAAAAALVLRAWWAPPATAGVEVVLLDVGQGDAILLRAGERAVLVDGGGWRRPGFGGRVLVPALAGLGVRRLHALAVTHGDVDHCGGAADLVREIPVGVVWTPSGLRATRCGEALAAPGGPRLVELRPGERRSAGAWSLLALAPEADGRGSDNDRSLVLRATALGRCVLLTGDLERAGEASLAARWPAQALRCDLLKVGHHGSAGATSSAFLAVTQPRLALVSAGPGNAYGHPAPAILAKLQRHRVQVLRTDRHGMTRVGWVEGGPLRVATGGG